MKLLKCNACFDIFNLVTDRIKNCSCTQSFGQYDEDGLNAWYVGPCEMIGFANQSFSNAMILNVALPPASGAYGHKFDAFIIPEAAPTVRRSNLVREVDKQRKAS